MATHLDIAKELGVPDLIERYWDEPEDPEEMAETVVFMQQSKVLHKDNPFWCDVDEFSRRLLPILKRYIKEVGNAIAAHLGASGATRDAVLQLKGSLGLRWSDIAQMDGLAEACQQIPISKTAYISPTQLVERKFIKLLLDYYSQDLQAVYYGMLYWVHSRLGGETEDDGQGQGDNNDGNDDGNGEDGNDDGNGEDGNDDDDDTFNF